MTATILLVDDKLEHLQKLEKDLNALLKGVDVAVKIWQPEQKGGDADGDPRAVFDKFAAENDLRLVVTDYDLTKKGLLGLFGSAIVEWCQKQYIPVGDFSLGHPDSLPKEPSLFELRIPTDPGTPAPFIAAAFLGFQKIRTAFEQDAQLLKKRSPIAALAVILGAPHEANRLSLYATRYGSANSSLMDVMMENQPKAGDTIKLLTYICGHLLLNAILRFPGPILNVPALLAYCAAGDEEAPLLEELFAAAKYEGPFSGMQPYYWFSKVEAKVQEVAAQLQPQPQAEYVGEFNRLVIEQHVGRALARNPHCERCNGQLGGFLCPMTKRIVCMREDCSVGTTSWIPQGASLSRIERDYYEEWSPLLGR